MGQEQSVKWGTDNDSGDEVFNITEEGDNWIVVSGDPICIPDDAIIAVTAEYTGSKIFSKEYTAMTYTSKLIQDLDDCMQPYLLSKGYMKIRYTVGKVHLRNHPEAVLKSHASSKGEITVIISVHALLIPPKWKDSYFNAIQLIGKPLKHMEVLVYNRYAFKMTIEKKFQKVCTSFEIGSASKIPFYSQNSAYCNGLNRLYISGGNDNYTEEGETERAVTVIDLQLKTYNIIKDAMMYPRSQHSMIAIPKKYVFIIGGQSKYVELLDTETGQCEIHSEMNELRREPGLAFVDDETLFVIEGRTGIMNDYTFNFEKINLIKVGAVWEIKTLVSPFTLSFDLYAPFGIALLGENSNSLIIFHFLNDDYSSPGFLFDYEDNSIKPATNVKYKVEQAKIRFGGEKFFLPTGEKENIHIPDIYGEEDNLKVLIYWGNILNEFVRGTYTG